MGLDDVINKIFPRSPQDPKHDPKLAIAESLGPIVDATSGFDCKGSATPSLTQLKGRSQVDADATLVPEDDCGWPRPRGRVSAPTSGAKPKPK